MISCDFVRNLFNKPEQPETTTSNNQQQNQKKDTRMEYKTAQKEFLNSNKNKEGVQTTKSGLQYKIIKEGTGKSPHTQSIVEVHYQGTLINGKEFDSSYKRNKTATFSLNQVITGWTEGLQLMREGATYEFHIPSELAYGEQDMRTIPGGSTLIFKVELIKVQ